MYIKKKQTKMFLYQLKKLTLATFISLYFLCFVELTRCCNKSVEHFTEVNKK